MATENPTPFNLTEWETDPKHQASRDSFDAMVKSALTRAQAKSAAEQAEEERKRRDAIPFPFNLFIK